MIQYVLYPTTLISINKSVPYVVIDKSNYLDNLDIVYQSINIFNSQIKWEDMYNITDAIDRFKNGYTMYVLYDNLVFGYMWFSKYLDGVYLQNLFMLKSKTQKWRATELLSAIIENHYNLTKIYCYIDDWNILSQKVVLKLGFLEKK
jgi:RimJ/RimL family protein N-acetyltransferase